MREEQCKCLRCGETFADPLAWAAHKPLGNLTRFEDCRFPRSLYRSGGVWTLRPSFRAEIEAKEAAGEEWRLQA
jgi:hypothetical protein